MSISVVAETIFIHIKAITVVIAAASLITGLGVGFVAGMVFFAREVRK